MLGDRSDLGADRVDVRWRLFAERRDRSDAVLRRVGPPPIRHDQAIARRLGSGWTDRTTGLSTMAALIAGVR